MIRLKSSNPYRLFWPVVLLILTFGLRIWALDVRPLWWDEGLTLTFSRLHPAANAAFAAITEDVNPPLYRWGTGVITFLTGYSIFSARLLSVFAGLIMAAAFYAVGRLAFGKKAAKWGLFLLALSPMQIYYAQEAKGYAFAAAAVMVGLLLWVLLHRWAFSPKPSRVEAGRWWVWLGYGLTVTLALGANYLAIFALVVENLFSLILTIRARRAGIEGRLLAKHWMRWLTVQIAGALLLLPYAAATLGSTSAGLADTSRGQINYNLFAFLEEFFSVFLAGELTIWPIVLLVIFLLLFLAAIGFLVQGLSKGRLSRSQKDIEQRLNGVTGNYSSETGHRHTFYFQKFLQFRLAAWFALLWLMVPLVLGYLFHLRYPWFFPRFLLYAQPGLLALAGAGLSAILSWLYVSFPRSGRLPAAAAVVLVSLLCAPLLREQYTAPPRFEEDAAWPLLFEHMRPLVKEGDVVIARLPWMPGYMDTYLLPGTSPTWVLGFFDEQKLDQEFGPLLQQYDRLWEIDYVINPFQPPVDTIRWLQGRAALVETKQFGPGTLTLLVDAAALTPREAGETQVSGFTNGVYVRWQPGHYQVHTGDVVGLDLVWWTETDLNTRLVRFLHLMTEDGRLASQVDSEPVMGYSMSYEWQPGDPVADPVALLIPLVMPPGEYELWLGLYDRDTVERVPLMQGDDHLVVGKVTVKE